MQNFINELSKYLENNLGNGKTETPILDEILSKNQLSTANENSIRWKFDEVILKYAEQKFSNEAMYFIKDSKKAYWANNARHYNNNAFAVLKVENNQIEEMEINKKDMPKDIGVNDVFKIEDNKYIINKTATAELKEEIKNMAKEIINKQDEKLAKHRKEGHLYMVSEEIGNNRFLVDLTEKSKIEFEETNIPKDLLDKATEGAVLQYINGTYEYYSDDGFERLDNIEKH